MSKHILKQFCVFLIVSILLNNIYMFNALACSRVLYTSSNGIVMTGRTTDWYDDVDSNIWTFPRGLVRNGLSGKNSLTWTVKYGSIITSVHDVLPIDGMNEKGLVMNMLYLKESKFIQPSPKDSRKTISLSLWGQYILDNYATVAEAIKDIRSNRYYIVSFKDEKGKETGLHLSISDAKGDSAILEYVNGELKIYHGKQYKVLTNSPEYSQQLAIRDYWKKVDGAKFLPGTNNAADRFIRASFYLDSVPQTKNDKIALSTVLSIIRSISVPVGIKTPDEPNIASTSWRTVADQKNKVYYFESVFENNLIWINLKNIDFSKGQPIRKLNLQRQPYYMGEVSESFQEVDGFNFYPIEGMEIPKKN